MHIINLKINVLMLRKLTSHLLFLIYHLSNILKYFFQRLVVNENVKLS